MVTKNFVSITSPIIIAIVALSTLIPLAYAQSAITPATSTSTTGTPTPVVTPTPTTVPVVHPYTIESISGNNLQVGDFVVGPGRLEVTVKPGETVVRNMTVTNRVSNGRKFSLSVEDMSGSADPTQSVVLLGDQNGPYTLKDNISFASKTFNLDLGERAVIPVSITMPPNAEPGGYYGAVLVSTVQDEGETDASAGARSPVISRIGTLFFITVPGKTDISGSVTNFSTKNDQWWFEKGPVNMSILYENTGAVHLNPYGEVRISNMLGEEVGFVEVDPWFVLPKSLRLREVSWDREFLFGRYTITVKINRGYENVIDEKTIHIWVLPWKILLGIFAGLFTLITLIRFFFKSFEFKRKGS